MKYKKNRNLESVSAKMELFFSPTSCVPTLPYPRWAHTLPACCTSGESVRMLYRWRVRMFAASYNHIPPSPVPSRRATPTSLIRCRHRWLLTTRGERPDDENSPVVQLILFFFPIAREDNLFMPTEPRRGGPSRTGRRAPATVRRTKGYQRLRSAE
jgi:hypothetical protein